MKKKESGAEGRKRRKLEAEEAKKSKKFFITFFEKHETSNSTCAMSSTPFTSLLEHKGGLNINASQAEKEVMSDKSEYEYLRLSLLKKI